MKKKGVQDSKGKKRKINANIIKRMNKDEDRIEEKLLRKEHQVETHFWKKVYKYFHTHIDNYESTHGRRLEGTLFFLNLVAITLFVIETHNLTPSTLFIVRKIEFAVIVVFIVEYAVRMWVAERKLKHFLGIYSIIDLISIVPILTHFGNLGFFRIFRILRLFRLLRVMRVLRFQRMFRQKETMFGALSDTQLIIIRIVLTVFTIIFVSSGMIWFVESKINPNYGTIWHAMYFSIVTLSTVGYGDITPLSWWGRVITVLMILSGIALIPWQLGKLIKVLFTSSTKMQVECSKCGHREHDTDAVHCKMCGAVIKKKPNLE